MIAGTSQIVLGQKFSCEEVEGSFNWSGDFEETLFAAAPYGSLPVVTATALIPGALEDISFESRARIEQQVEHLELSRSGMTGVDIVEDVLTKAQDLRAGFHQAHPFLVDEETAAATAPAVYVRAYRLQSLAQVRATLLTYMDLVDSPFDGAIGRRIAAKDAYHQAPGSLWLEYRGSTEYTVVHRMDADISEVKKDLKSLANDKEGRIKLWPFVSYVCAGGASRTADEEAFWANVLEILETYNQAFSIAEDQVAIPFAVAPCIFGLIGSMEPSAGERGNSSSGRPPRTLSNMIPGGSKVLSTDLHLAKFETPVFASLQQDVYLLVTSQKRVTAFSIRNEVLAHTTTSVLNNALEGPVDIQCLTLDPDAALASRRSAATAATNAALQTSFKATVESSGLLVAQGVAIVRGANLFWLSLEYIKHDDPVAQSQWLHVQSGVAAYTSVAASSTSLAPNERRVRRWQWPASRKSHRRPISPFVQRSWRSRSQSRR